MMTKMTEFKVCSKCGREKESPLFRPCKGGKYGVRAECRECELAYKKYYREKNKKKIATSYKQWAVKNKDTKNALNTRWFKKKLKSDPTFRLATSVRNLINISLRNKGVSKNRNTKEIVGCSFADLKNHIERQFVKGMCWENRSEWHIDHITPISFAKTDDDVIKLNHFTNLRPLWAKENIVKSNKIAFLI